MAAVFESLGQTFRSEAYAEYKANRAEMPPDLVAQIPYVECFIEAFRLPLLEFPGFEADDVIGALARQAADACSDVVIVSCDKDMLQLVNDRVFMLNPVKDDAWYDAAKVEEFMGVEPCQVADLLALKGDSVDNIPGAPGIGEKGAIDILTRFGSVEAALDRAAEVAKRTYRESLLNHRDRILLSQRLATIHCDVPIPFDLAALRIQTPDSEALKVVFKELEFFSLLEGSRAVRGFAAPRFLRLPSRPPQPSAPFSEEMNLPSPVKYGKGKVISTAADVLESLAPAYPVAQLVLDYRQLTKLKGTYIDALPLLIRGETGRVHTTFNQAGAATGRLSSSNPNLQNIPIRTEEGREIRAAFIPEPSWELLVADYSQIELRLLAHMSTDPVLTASFRNGEDIHTRTAAEVFKVDPLMVNAEMRRSAKAVNFGIVYGTRRRSVWRQTLGISIAKRPRPYITALLRALRWRPRVHRSNHRGSTADRCSQNAPWAAPSHSGYAEPQSRRSLLCRTNRRKHPLAGHGCGSHQTRHDSRAAPLGRKANAGSYAAAGSR